VGGRELSHETKDKIELQVDLTQSFLTKTRKNQVPPSVTCDNGLIVASHIETFSSTLPRLAVTGIVNQKQLSDNPPDLVAAVNEFHGNFPLDRIDCHSIAENWGFSLRFPFSVSLSCPVLFCSFSLRRSLDEHTNLRNKSHRRLLGKIVV
jgi:hypothetical protein